MTDLKDRIETYITNHEIEKKIDKLAEQIQKDYAGQNVTLICILKGAFMFFSELVKRLNIDLKTLFITASSYGSSTTSSGNVLSTVGDLDMADIKNKNIIIVEDIVDTGHTYHTLIKGIKQFKPKSVKFATLIFKPSRLEIEVNIDYVGFEIENKFIVGYGCDYEEKYRELIYIGFLK